MARCKAERLMRRLGLRGVMHGERLAEASIEPSVGSKGDSYDDALAEIAPGFVEVSWFKSGLHVVA